MESSLTDIDYLQAFQKARMNKSKKIDTCIEDSEQNLGEMCVGTKLAYSEHAYRHKILEYVFYLDGPVTEKNTMNLRLQLTNFITCVRLGNGQKNIMTSEADAFQVPPFIILMINSRGGDMVEALSLCSLIESFQVLNIDTIAIVNGIAYSAAFLVMSSCKYRYMLPHSHLMCHEFKASSAGKSSEIENDKTRLDHYREVSILQICKMEPDINKSEKYKNFISDRNDIPPGEGIIRFISEHIRILHIDTFMNFKNAWLLGIIHGVITPSVYGILLSNAYNPDVKNIMGPDNMQKIYDNDMNTKSNCAEVRNRAKELKQCQVDFEDVSKWPFSMSPNLSSIKNTYTESLQSDENSSIVSFESEKNMHAGAQSTVIEDAFDAETEGTSVTENENASAADIESTSVIEIKNLPVAGNQEVLLNDDGDVSGSDIINPKYSEGSDEDDWGIENI